LHGQGRLTHIPKKASKPGCIPGANLTRKSASLLLGLKSFPRAAEPNTSSLWMP
jgi:hypothetical protein